MGVGLARTKRGQTARGAPAPRRKPPSPRPSGGRASTERVFTLSDPRRRLRRAFQTVTPPAGLEPAQRLGLRSGRPAPADYKSQVASRPRGGGRGLPTRRASHRCPAAIGVLPAAEGCLLQAALAVSAGGPCAPTLSASLLAMPDSRMRVRRRRPGKEAPASQPRALPPLGCGR